MLKQEKHLAKFSHRLFGQYFISSIIPVIVLSLISFYTVSELLKKNATRQIYAESRAVGRILTIESNILNISKSIGSKDIVNNNTWIRKMYSSLYIIDSEGNIKVFFGKDIIVFELSQFQLNHLNKNKRLLLIHKIEKNKYHILMLHTLNHDSNQFLVVLLNPDYLWNITIKESDAFCGIVDRKFIVYCSDIIYQSENISKIKDQLASLNKNSLYEVL